MISAEEEDVERTVVVVELHDDEVSAAAIQEEDDDGVVFLPYRLMRRVAERATVTVVEAIILIKKIKIYVVLW